MLYRRGKSDILAVSEVLGNILLVVNSIVIAGAIYAMFMGYSMSLPEAQATFEFDYYEDTDVMNITMTSGNSISSGEILLYQYHQDILTERYELADHLDDINNNGKWDTGEICSVTLGRELEEGDELSVYDRSNDRVVDEFVYTLATVSGGIDLKISTEDIIIQKSEVYQNDVNVQITAWVFNIGSENAEDDINVMFRDEFQGINRFIGMTTIGGGIPGGETKAATIQWTPSNLFGENCVGFHEIKVQVLPYRGESNVANNDADMNEYVRIYTTPITVPEEPDLSITPLDVSYTPELPQRGDYIYINGIIVNLGSTYATCTVEIYDGDVEDTDHDGVIDTSPLPPMVAKRKNIYVRDISDFMLVWDNATGGLHNLSLVITDIVSDEPSLEEDNYANNIAIKQVFVKPKILIVDDDNFTDTNTLSDSTRFLRNSVNAIGYSYDFYYVAPNRLGPVYESTYSSVELRNYDVVIWQTGFEDNNTLQPADVENLTRYLDSGGKLWLIGTDILDDFVYNNDVQGKDFLTRYCGVNMSTVERNFELQAINGTLNPYLNTSDMDCSARSAGPEFQRSDNFTVVANQTQGWKSHAVFFDGISDRHSIASANYNQSIDGKALFFSFDIAMFSSPAYRAQTVYKVMKWFGTAIRGEIHDLAVVDVQVYPEDPKYMDDLTISVIVQNNGNLMEPEVAVAFYANGQLIPEYPYGDQNIQTIYDLDGNGTLSTTLQKQMLLVDPGEIEITVRVDPFDAITEISETNNDASYSAELVSSIQVGNNILVVDDDNATAWPHDVTGNITRSLNYLGYDFTRMTYTDGSDGPNLDTLKSYNIVIWCTGNETENTLTDDDLLAVADYLEGDFDEAIYFRLETHLVLIGQGILNDLMARGETTFIHQYLHVDTTSLGLDVGIPDSLTGVRNNGITHGLSYDTAPIFEDSGDAVEPRGGARGIFRSLGGRYCALSYDWNDVGGDMYKLIFMPAELGFVSSGIEDGRQWMHQCEFLYLGLQFLGYGDERLELTTADVDVNVNEIHPVLGRSYTLAAKIYNHGNERESVIVRFMDGNTILKSVSTTVIEGGNTSVDFIWAPLFAGPRTLGIRVDPDNDKDEIFDELNNRAQYGTYVYFFYDDMENGTGNWDHDATILRINGEDQSGVVVGRGDVFLGIALDNSHSMSNREYPPGSGTTWLDHAKEGAISLVNSLSDESVVCVWTFEGATVGHPVSATELSGNGRDDVINGINGIEAKPITSIWDATGEAYMEVHDNIGAYPDLAPAVAILGDGGDIASADGSANLLMLESGSKDWAPWGDMQPESGYPTQNYPSHLGKYQFPYTAYTPSDDGTWRRANGPQYNEDRKGLLHSDIPIYTIGLGVEHFDNIPDWDQVTTNVEPSDGDVTTEDVYKNPSGTNDPENKEAGTLEYNLWRIATTSGAKYYFAPTPDELAGIFYQISQDIGGLVTRSDTRDGSVLEYIDPPIFSHVEDDWLTKRGFHVNTEIDNDLVADIYRSSSTSYVMHEPKGSIHTPVDVVLTLDNSGSMGGAIEALKDAATDFVNQLNDTDRCAIYTYGFENGNSGIHDKDHDRPWLCQPFVTMGDENVLGSGLTGREYTLATINDDTCDHFFDFADPWTVIWDTTYDAIDYALSNSEPGHVKVVLAMTDGEDTSSERNSWGNEDSEEFPDGDDDGKMGNPDGDIVDDYGDGYVGSDGIDGGTCNAPLPVFTIGLGLTHNDPPATGSTEAQLAEIGRTSSGGDYYHAPDGSDLQDIYDDIAATVANMAQQATRGPGGTRGTRASGTILREYWTGISGTSVSDLTGHADYPDNPDGSTEPALFEAPTNWDDDYGQRMRGWLKPPTTGDYRFWISSDDNSELWLSTDETEANKVLIAYEDSWTGERVWETGGNEESSLITLQADQWYYIEALMKEGGGGDNLAVAWEGPGIAQEVIPGAYLTKWTATGPPGGGTEVDLENPWYDGNSTGRDKYLETPPLDLVNVSGAALSFYHKYNMKIGANGGVIQVGVPEDPDEPYGAYDWQYVQPRQPYPGNILTSEWKNRVDDNGKTMAWCWNGVSGDGTLDWEKEEVNLNRFVGNWVKIRFYYLYCTGGTGYGWIIDDVEVNVERNDNTWVDESMPDQWQWVTGVSHSGDHSWWCGVPDTQELGNGIDNSLYTRPIDLTLAVNATLEAYMKFNIPTEPGRPPDGFRVEVSSDGGNNWLPLVYGVRAAWNVSGSEGDMSDGVEDNRSYSGLDPDGDGWVKASTLTRLNVELNGFIGNVIILRFRVVTTANDLGQDINPYYGVDHIADPGAGFGGFYLDDVQVYGWSQTTSRAAQSNGELETSAVVRQGGPKENTAATSNIYQTPEVGTSFEPEEKIDVEVSEERGAPVQKHIDQPEEESHISEKRGVEASDGPMVKDPHAEAVVADIAWKKDKYILGDMVYDAL